MHLQMAGTGPKLMKMIVVKIVKTVPKCRFLKLLKCGRIG